MKQRRKSAAVAAMEARDIRVFLDADVYVVRVCRDHWNLISREEFSKGQARLALETAKKDERSLLYVSMAGGKAASFGFVEYEQLELALLEEEARNEMLMGKKHE